MIFIIPIILGAAALASAAFGVGAGIAGMSDIEEANAIAKEAEEVYQEACSVLNAERDLTNELAKEYGQLKIDIKLTTMKHVVELMRRIGQRASLKDMKFLEELGISIEQIQKYEVAVLEAERLVGGGFGAASAAVATSQSTVALVGLFGTASTGTAISGLSGAAAWNATLAWLGGGSLAAGGGGMALGSLVLGGIAVGPALAVFGFALASKGEKALTEVQKYVSQVNVAIEKIEATMDFLQQVQQRICELAELLESIDEKAVSEIENLEYELRFRSFDKDKDEKKLEKVCFFMKALGDIIDVPILDNEFKLNPYSATIYAKYRTLSFKGI